MPVVKNKDWKQAQEWEQAWWDTCRNTFDEEVKQRYYALKMGLKSAGYGYDAENKSVIDVGGGPVSLLLKCDNLKMGVVVDPCRFPDWVYARYDCAGIIYHRLPAELMAKSFGKIVFDEAWLYNVLLHVQDPEKVVFNARSIAKTIRVFEFVNTYKSAGHPHVFTAPQLDKWLGGTGNTELVNESSILGQIYYGVFNGEK